MVIIILNKDGTIHHVKTDNAGAYPCYAIDREFSKDSARGVEVYSTSYDEMDKLQKQILEVVNQK